MLPIAILAGGLATRLRPATETVPKALLGIDGEPFLGRQLQLLARNGLERAVLCVGFLGERIRAYAGDGRKLTDSKRMLKKSPGFGDSAPKSTANVRLWL